MHQPDYTRNRYKISSFLGVHFASAQSHPHTAGCRLSQYILLLRYFLILTTDFYHLFAHLNEDIISRIFTHCSKAVYKFMPYPCSLFKIYFISLFCIFCIAMVNVTVKYLSHNWPYNVINDESTILCLQIPAHLK